MKTASILNDVEYKEDKPSITVLFETEHTKEIRIAMRKGQLMKAHKTPFPIIIEIFEGEIEFGLLEDKFLLTRGDLIALDGNVTHDLTARADSLVRLTLTKHDQLERVEKVVDP